MEYSMKYIKPAMFSKMMQPGALGLKRSAYSMIGGALPISTIPMMMGISSKFNSSLRGLSNRVSPRGNVMVSGKNGFVNGNTASIPFYLNKMRRK